MNNLQNCVNQLLPSNYTVMSEQYLPENQIELFTLAHSDKLVIVQIAANVGMVTLGHADGNRFISESHLGFVKRDGDVWSI